MRYHRWLIYLFLVACSAQIAPQQLNPAQAAQMAQAMQAQMQAQAQAAQMGRQAMMPWYIPGTSGGPITVLPPTQPPKPQIRLEEPILFLMQMLRTGSLKGLGYKWMADLLDDYGSRLVGEPALDKVIDIVVDDLKKGGFDNVHTEDVDDVPHFKRGDDKAMILEPRNVSLRILAIPNTAPGTVQAEAVVFETKEEFDRADVKGKIVVFAQKWEGYSKSIYYRKMTDAVHAKGGLAVVASSVTPFSLATPHTGMGTENITIPAVNVIPEQAQLMLRWARRNKKIVIKLEVKSETLKKKACTRNVIFDIKGSTNDHEVAMLACHIDSWDVGQGAIDDMGGCAAILYAMKAIKLLIKNYPQFAPRRTIRGIFFSGEEQGNFGARQYYRVHPANGLLEKFVFVGETDYGPFRPLTRSSVMRFFGTNEQAPHIRLVAQYINKAGIPLGVNASREQGQVVYWAEEGVPSVHYISDRSLDRYFWFHHTEADTVDHLEPADIDDVAAIFVAHAYYYGNFGLEPIPGPVPAPVPVPYIRQA